jgi:two-component system NtrC family sensor kinase
MSNHTAKTPGPIDLITLNRAATMARLLAGVAHEVNNALQVIGGMTELLESTPDLPPSVADGLQRIAAQTTRAATALQEVMLFARKNVTAPARINLREMATRCVALRAFAIGRARLSIVLDASPAGRFEVMGNEALLQQAVLNLIINAEQALAGQKGGAMRVELDVSGAKPDAPSGDVVLRVTDNGPGVEPAVAEELFDSFFTTRARDEASGLGLSAARLVAEQHGGTLTFEPRDRGASFALRLPAAS